MFQISKQGFPFIVTGWDIRLFGGLSMR